MYADDSTIFLRNDETELRNAIEILQKFYRISGLQIHLGKTQCVKIGTGTRERQNMAADLGLTWDQRFKLLGIDFDADTLDYNCNVKSKLEEIDKVAKRLEAQIPLSNRKMHSCKNSNAWKDQPFSVCFTQG